MNFQNQQIDNHSYPQDYIHDFHIQPLDIPNNTSLEPLRQQRILHTHSLRQAVERGRAEVHRAEHVGALDKDRREASFGKPSLGIGEHHLKHASGVPGGVVKRPVTRLVAEPEIARIDGEGQEDAARRTFQRQRNRPRFKSDRPAARDSQADFMRRVEIEGERLDLVSRLVPVKGQAQNARTFLGAFEMEFEQRNAPVGGEQHGFEKIEIRRALSLRRLNQPKPL